MATDYVCCTCMMCKMNKHGIRDNGQLIELNTVAFITQLSSCSVLLTEFV